MPTKPNTPRTPAPIVTLSTDFGLADAYVAAMKAAVLRRAPDARLIDVSHEIPPQDILLGSFVLERALDAFDPGTIHLAVVDPGVGTRRKILLVEIHRQWVVCPDNGLITWGWRRWGDSARSRELTWRPPRVSSTFHGRDIMAPAVGMLASGKKPSTLTDRACIPRLLKVTPAKRPAKGGEIIYIDRFGNAITNIPGSALPRGNCKISVGGKNLGSIKLTYEDVQKGECLALIGSAELLEIAVRDGSAQRELRLHIGDKVRVD
jgi:S-adenosyl-L-methionine hydrolase (adenosine-forming)